MEKTCKNCEYFVQISIMSKHTWGDCMKTASSIEADCMKKRGTFTWAYKNCSDFKPKKVLR
jgi:hypothetical protein